MRQVRTPMGPFEPARYWERRYRAGRTSGAASEGSAAQAKADYLADQIVREEIGSVIDWGCGDGEVIARLPDDLWVRYTGVDLSSSALTRCRSRLGERHPSWAFLLDPTGYSYGFLRADLTLSLDVLFHLVDDRLYGLYLDRLFGTSTRLVLIHSTDEPAGRTAYHVRRRRFTSDVAARFPAWELARRDDGVLGADWFLYRC